MSEQVCAAARALAGGCLDVALYVLLPDDELAGEKAAAPSALGGGPPPHRGAAEPRRLYRITPPAGRRSSAEARLIDGVVLDAGAHEVPLASLAGDCACKGRVVHVHRDAPSHPRYDADADRTAHLPPPGALLYVPIPTHGLPLEGFGACVRLALPARSSPSASASLLAADVPVALAQRRFARAQVDAVVSGAPVLALALRGCFGAAAEARRLRLAALLSGVGTDSLRARPAAGDPLKAAMSALKDTLRACASDVADRLGASACLFWLLSADTGALYTLADDAADLEAPAQISLALESPTELSLLGEGAEEYALEPYDRASAAQADASDGLVQVTIALDPTSGGVRPRSTLTAAAVAVHAAATGDGEPVNIADSRTHFLTRPAADGAPSVGLLAVPFFSPTSAKMLGVLEVRGKAGAPCFSSDDVVLLQARLRLAALEVDHHMMKATMSGPTRE